MLFISREYQPFQLSRQCKVMQQEIFDAEKLLRFSGVIVAKPQPFDCHDPDVCGADIFQKLVPLVIETWWRRFKRFVFDFSRMHILQHRNTVKKKQNFYGRLSN